MTSLGGKFLVVKRGEERGSTRSPMCNVRMFFRGSRLVKRTKHLESVEKKEKEKWGGSSNSVRSAPSCRLHTLEKK